MKKKIVIIIYILLINPVFSDEKMDLGLDIFNNKAECSSCHKLKSSNSNGEIGPNLDQLRPTFEQVLAAVTRGIGVMPAFDGILNLKEIEAVSYFVSESTK